jgi:hypothetical protein
MRGEALTVIVESTLNARLRRYVFSLAFYAESAKGELFHFVALA